MYGNVYGSVGLCSSHLSPDLLHIYYIYFCLQKADVFMISFQIIIIMNESDHKGMEYWTANELEVIYRASERRRVNNILHASIWSRSLRPLTAEYCL